MASLLGAANGLSMAWHGLRGTTSITTVACERETVFRPVLLSAHEDAWNDNTYRGRYDTYRGDLVGYDTYRGCRGRYDTYRGDLVGYDTYRGDLVGYDTYRRDLVGYDTYRGCRGRYDTYRGDLVGYDTYRGDLGPILPRWGRRHVPTMSPLYVPMAPFHRTSGDGCRWRPVSFRRIVSSISRWTGRGGNQGYALWVRSVNQHDIVCIINS